MFMFQVSNPEVINIMAPLVYKITAVITVSVHPSSYGTADSVLSLSVTNSVKPKVCTLTINVFLFLMDAIVVTGVVIAPLEITVPESFLCVVTET
jgi:hypothetical protein